MGHRTMISRAGRQSGDCGWRLVNERIMRQWEGGGIGKRELEDRKQVMKGDRLWRAVILRNGGSVVVRFWSWVG
jgi:hypothetical protein